MQPILDDGVVTALSSFRSENSWLMFFVDGGDGAGRKIAAVLESWSSSLRDKNMVVMSTQYHSELHLQFEDVYGPTPGNTVTFVSRRGAAVIRWKGHGNIEEVVEEILGINSVPDAELREFGYPSEEFVRYLMLGNSDSEEVPVANWSASPLESLEKEIQPSTDKEMQASVEKEMQASVEKEMQASVEKEMQASVEKEMQASVENEMQASGLSGKKNIPGQPKELTVLQIRCPDGSSVTKTFKTSSLLSEVRVYIAAHFSSEGFGLATSFPRHHYVSEDYSRNLGELDLWPNAVLLIVPADPRQESNNMSLRSYTANFSSWAYSLIKYMWNRISRFFPFTAGGNSQPETNTSDRLANAQPGPSGSRHRSNIHTLRDKEKDDDKRRTTYNGNSTQQL
ncbi:UBX domain-containing protein 4-like isoform X1 [Schistocerca nitens]|uniref:UBX domain-containing protein 4-like isoform X1 n=1 Tax=Schistocerca nitens TaxID=7011 RepID=UPI002117BBA6|nr:UBX domain-containing protein 4-like isoform X1 [Schistocerca nitens]